MTTRYDTHYDRLYQDTWLQKYWRPACAVVYLAICLFDFVIMPCWIQASFDSVPKMDLIQQSLKFPDAQKSNALATLVSHPEWDPLTLHGSGTFHLAFGAILGAAAYTRGREKMQRLQNIAAIQAGQGLLPAPATPTTVVPAAVATAAPTSPPPTATTVTTTAAVSTVPVSNAPTPSVPT